MMNHRARLTTTVTALATIQSIGLFLPYCSLALLRPIAHPTPFMSSGTTISRSRHVQYTALKSSHCGIY